MGEILTVFEKPDKSQLVLLQAHWENKFEEHLGKGHASLGLTTDLKSSLEGLSGRYEKRKVYMSCVPSAMALMPEWKGVDKKIIAILMTHNETKQKCHLACLVSTSMTLKRFQKKVDRLVDNIGDL